MTCHAPFTTIITQYAGATSIEAVAGEAAEHALQLRQTSDKGARLRKKKALNDLLKALGEMGFSRSRSAVPINDRNVQAWFTQVRRTHNWLPNQPCCAASYKHSRLSCPQACTPHPCTETSTNVSLTTWPCQALCHIPHIASLKNVLHTNFV